MSESNLEPASAAALGDQPRLTLRAKVAISVYGIILLSIVVGSVALAMAWHLQAAMQAIVRENVESLRAAEELEIALLDQRGFVSAYMLDGGDDHWLRELESKEPRFDEWMAKAQASVQTEEERQILARLAELYEKYVRKRREAIELYDSGETEGATRVLLGDVRVLYDQAFELSEEFIAANDRYVASTTDTARKNISLMTWLVAIGSLLTIGSGLIVIGLFHFGVRVPLRQMVAQVESVRSDRVAEGPPAKDELKAVGLHLRTLMSDAEEARNQLEVSQNRVAMSEKLASVGKLAASVAHEVRNPLTSMQMWLYSMRRSVADDPELSSNLDLITGEAARIEGILRSFLEFCRPQELNVQQHQSAVLIDKTLELMMGRLRHCNIEVSRNDDASLPPILADAQQLKQVFINLVCNSIDAMPSGGRITISANLNKDRVGPAMVVIRFADTGEGMPDDVRAKIFEPFYSTKELGTGLGLCIAASIMDRHGGRLVAEATSCHGTTFAVWVPIAVEE